MSGVRFSSGMSVRVCERRTTGHHRTPRYVQGHTGIVLSLIGCFPWPEHLAERRQDGPLAALYRVRFRQAELWPDYAGAPSDDLDIELYEHWLEPEQTT